MLDRRRAAGRSPGGYATGREVNREPTGAIPWALFDYAFLQPRFVLVHRQTGNGEGTSAFAGHIGVFERGPS